MIVFDKDCEPAENDSNNCFIIQGGVTIAIEDDDSADLIAAIVHDVTEAAMTNDELLSDDQPMIEKVTFIGDDEDDEDDPIIIPIVTGEVAQSGNLGGIIIGTAFAAVAVLAGIMCLVFRKKKEEEDTNEFDLVEFPGVTHDSSFVAADIDNLATHGTCMDVHQCKSQTCHRCYQNKKLQLVKAAQNSNGLFARANVDSLPDMVVASDSFDTIKTDEFFCANRC